MAEPREQGHQGDEDDDQAARPGRLIPHSDTPPGLFLGDDPTNVPGPELARHQSDAAQAARRAAGLPLAASLVPPLGLLPVTAAVLVPFWAVTDLVISLGFVEFFVGYLTTGAALAAPRVQRFLLTTLFAVRAPTPRELGILEPAWHNVADAAGIAQDGYVLAVSDSPHIDAVAAGGRTLAVTRLTLDIASAGEVEAALAHELGHHLGAQGVSRTMTLWLEAPLALFARLSQWLELTAYVLALLFAWHATTAEPVKLTDPQSWEPWAPVAAALIAGLGVRIASYLVPAALDATSLLHTIRAYLARFTTYHADQFTVELGYGDDLIELLERSVDYHLDDSNSSGGPGRRSLVSRRIKRIEAHLD